MFNTRVASLLLIAAVLSLLASLLVKKMVTQTETSAVPAAPIETGKTVILVASSDVGYLHVIQEADIREHAISTSELPADASLYFSSPSEVVGKVAMTGIRTGVPLMRADFKNREGGAILALDIRPEYRAVSIRVDDVKGVAGFLLRGSLVDILATIEMQKDGGVQTRLVAEGVRVLAVDQIVENQEGKPILARAVTVELLPGQAEDLARAQQAGTVSLSLRNPEDVEMPKKVLNRPKSIEEKKMLTLYKGADHGGIQVIECEAKGACVSIISGQGGKQ